MEAKAKKKRQKSFVVSEKHCNFAVE